MGFTKAKSQTRTTNATMLTHQEATAPSHEPEKLGLDTVQLGEGHITPQGVCGGLHIGELSLDQVLRSGRHSTQQQEPAGMGEVLN